LQDDRSEAAQEDELNKLTALICVVAWSFFATFGYLTLTTLHSESSQAHITMVLAMLGFLTGMSTWIRLAREAH